MNKNNKSGTGIEYEWRESCKKAFPYKSTDDPKYIKERNEFFAKSGNGWWWWQGTYINKNKLKKEEAKNAKKESES